MQRNLLLQFVSGLGKKIASLTGLLGVSIHPFNIDFEILYLCMFRVLRIYKIQITAYKFEICTVESGNIARPLTLRIKNVNGRSKILSVLMSILP